MFLVPHNHLHLVGQREDKDRDPIEDLNKMKDKHMARNYSSLSMKVMWTGKLPKCVSYPSQLWWTLKTALHYFNRGANQKNCPQVRLWVVTVPKGIWALCFWNTLIWLLSLFASASGSIVFTIISISYLPEPLELHHLSHNSWQSYWFYLPSCLQSCFG